MPDIFPDFVGPERMWTNREPGIDEVRLKFEDIIGLFNAPENFKRLGDREKNALLIGSPDIGRMILEKADKAKVLHFNTANLDFSRVGLGAFQLRKLFEQARVEAPRIIFIDGLNAVGKPRGAHTSGTHDEREQIVNQLLVEMDGLERGPDIIIIGMIPYYPEPLDPALLRPGRFSLRIIVEDCTDAKRQ